ncbi:hypothetical protein [Helicobacter sp. T3_23-1056]
MPFFILLLLCFENCLKSKTPFVRSIFELFLGFYERVSADKT